MKLLRELVFVINKCGVEEEHKPNFIKGKDDTDLLARLYRGILEGTYTSDTEAAMDLYKQLPSYPAYRMLKSRLRKQLLDCIFFLNIRQPKNAPSTENFYESSKNILRARFSIILGARNIGVDILHKTLL